MSDGPRTPSLSSDEILAALRRLGFVRPKAKASSHITLTHGTETHRTCTVVMGRGKDYPKGTLESALEQGGVTMSEFLIACGGKLKKEEKRRLKRQR